MGPPSCCNQTKTAPTALHTPLRSRSHLQRPCCKLLQVRPGYAAPVDPAPARTPPPAEEVAGYLERARALLRRVAEQVGAVPPAAPLPPGA